MSTVRTGTPGATRQCPHCKATVLESASVCPGCRHHLRFNANGAQPDMDETYRSLSIDGTIAHRPASEPCEYSVVLDIRNERGEQLVRQIIGVGALQPGELRRLNVAVDVTPVRVVAAMPKPAAKPVSTPLPATAAAIAAPPAAAAAAAAATATAAAAANKGMPPGPAGKLPPLQPVPAIKPPPAKGGRLGMFRKP